MPDGIVRVSDAFEFVNQEAFDFNGNWSGATIDGSDVLIEFVIRNNTLISGACNGFKTKAAVLSTDVTTGSFLANGPDGFHLAGRIVSTAQATGKVTGPDRSGAGESPGKRPSELTSRLPPHRSGKGDYEEKRPRVLVFAAVCFLAAGMASGQALTGTLIGSVRDRGAVLFDASIRLSSPSLLGSPARQKRRRGQLRFSALPPGSYVLDVTKPGFATLHEENVRIGAGATIERTAVLNQQEWRNPSWWRVREPASTRALLASARGSAPTM